MPDGGMANHMTPRQAAGAMLLDREGVFIRTSSTFLPPPPVTTRVSQDLTPEEAQEIIDEADMAAAIPVAEATEVAEAIQAVELVAAIEAPTEAVAAVRSLRRSADQGLGGALPMQRVLAVASWRENNNITSHNITDINSTALDQMSAQIATTTAQATSAIAAAQTRRVTDWEATTAEVTREPLPLPLRTNSSPSTGITTERVVAAGRAIAAAAPILDRNRNRDELVVTLSSPSLSGRSNNRTSINVGLAETSRPLRFPSGPEAITNLSRGAPAATLHIPVARPRVRSGRAAEGPVNKWTTRNSPTSRKRNDVFATPHSGQGGEVPNSSDEELLKAASSLAHSDSIAPANGMSETSIAVAQELR